MKENPIVKGLKAHSLFELLSFENGMLSDQQEFEHVNVYN